jgi:hypothetical protein
MASAISKPPLPRPRNIFLTIVRARRPLANLPFANLAFEEASADS